MIPKKLEKKITNILINRVGEKISILDIKYVSGGCINNTFKVVTDYGNFFLKWNNNASDMMFETEVKGLELLRKTETIYIPHVIDYNKDLLLMEFIEEENPIINFWDNFGRELSELHKKSNNFFGLDHNNFIGSLPQDNKKQFKWIDFFINQRIYPQLSIGNFSSEFLRSFDQLFIKIENLFPDESPSILHGDLWSGNFLVYKNKAALIDPAVYFGCREMDIAMSKLFGGFHERFYSSYNENYPLGDDWKERLDICNLYPLLVHVNLFGGGYYSQVREIVNRFI